MGFGLFDAEFYIFFEGVMIKIVILQFFKICPFFYILSAKQLQMRLPIHVSLQGAAQLLWSASGVHFHYDIINVHGSAQLTCEMHFQLCNRLS